MIATTHQRYFAPDHFDNIYGNGFDSSNLPEYDLSMIERWDDVINYSLLFLNAKIPQTVFHSGVYASETLYIINWLKLIHKYGFITLDSQPGCVIDGLTLEPMKDKKTSCVMQLPYLNLVGPIDQLQKLIDSISDPYIVIYQPEMKPIKNITLTLIQKLDRLKLDRDYGSVYLSVDGPLTSTFFNYIFADRFFENIVETLEVISKL
jgi:hypothetical protein